MLRAAKRSARALSSKEKMATEYDNGGRRSPGFFVVLLAVLVGAGLLGAFLQSQVRAKAQEQLEQAALSDCILEAATKNAHATVTSLLQGLGFTKVDVR